VRSPDRLLLALTLAAAAGGCARPLGERVLVATRGAWTRSGPVGRFTPGNLYNYIDGEAPLVISFGFRSLAQAVYQSGAGDEATVDIYDMGSADNAFALFRSHANVEAKPLEVGAEGAGGEGQVEFWQHRFYVAVSAPSLGEGQSLVPLARALARDLPPTTAWPGYLERLPATGRVARSEQYAPTDFLGHDFLKRTVSARYQVGGREAMVFACRYEQPSEAAAALARFEAYLRKEGATVALELGEGGLVGEVPYHGRIAVFRRGPFLGGMTRYAEGPATDGLLADLDRRLRAPLEQR